MRNPFVLGVGFLAGTIIGAGMFSLPYVVNRVGMGRGFFYLLVFTFVYLAIHFMYAEVVEARPEGHQFAYFAHAFLPQRIAAFVSFAIFAELVCVLVAYLILSPMFAASLGSVFAAHPAVVLIGFWFLSSLFIFTRLKWGGVAEVIGVAVILFIVVLVFVKSVSVPLAAPFFSPLTFSLFFLPFGPLLFSLAGRPAIAEVVALHRRSRHSFSLKKAIAWGTVLPAIIYAVFVVSVLRLNPSVPPAALAGLQSFFSPLLFGLLGVLGLLAIWTSYFVIGKNVRDILRLDWKLPGWFAAAVAVAGPLLLYIAGLRNFIEVISFTGGVLLAIEGFAVAAMWYRAFPKHPWRWVVWPLSAVFLAALVSEVAHILA